MPSGAVVDFPETSQSSAAAANEKLHEAERINV
jgi:hypothetical protein